MKSLILADDFTGSLDTGVQLSKYSVSATVMADPDTDPSPDEHREVLVINTNVRHAIPEKAYALTEQLLHKYMDTCTNIYIKTDSALRGNISAEFAAALKVLKKPLCFIPAFPNMGRTTKHADAYVDGDLLENSIFRDDPRTPTLQSHIPDILNKDYEVKCRCVPFDELDSFKDYELQNDTVYIFDCETNEQLAAIGNMIARQGLYAVTAGCAGFASTFVKHLSYQKFHAAPYKSDKPVFFISGSTNAVTLRQIKFAQQHGYMILSLSKYMFSGMENMDSEALMKHLEEPFDEVVLSKCKKTAVDALLKERGVVIATATDKQELFPFAEKFSDRDAQEAFETALHKYIADFTSTLGRMIIDEIPEGAFEDSFKTDIANISVFGGDMAAAVLGKLGCHQVQPLGEITAGVPLCQLTYRGNLFNLVTKSGGFGDEDIIPEIERYLQG